MVPIVLWVKRKFPKMAPKFPNYLGSILPLEQQLCGAGVVAMHLCSNFEEIAHVQGQRRRPSKTVQFSSVQSLSRVRLFATPWIAERQASLSITNSRSSLNLMSIESVMPSSQLILCHPLFLLPPIPPSIRIFSSESIFHMRWPKYWSFSFSISPSNEHPGLVSFRMDWLDLLTVQGILKSLLQHHSSKASILQRSAFFTVQLSHPYRPLEKPQPWLDGPLLAKWCLCFWICYLGWS